MRDLYSRSPHFPPPPSSTRHDSLQTQPQPRHGENSRPRDRHQALRVPRRPTSPRPKQPRSAAPPPRYGELAGDEDVEARAAEPASQRAHAQAGACTALGTVKKGVQRRTGWRQANQRPWRVCGGGASRQISPIPASGARWAAVAKSVAYGVSEVVGPDVKSRPTQHVEPGGHVVQKMTMRPAFLVQARCSRFMILLFCLQYARAVHFSIVE